MSDNQELSLEELYNTYTSEQQIKDSYEKRTVPTGRYTFTATKAEPRIAGDRSPWPGRQTGNFFGKLVDENGKKVGSIGFDASWEVQQGRPDRNGKVRQDGPSSLWGQMVTALGMKDKSVADVLTAAASYPLNVFVTEVFKDNEGKYQTAWNEEDRQKYRKLGYDSRNYVRSISKSG